MKKLLITILAGVSIFAGWFFYEKPQPPFGAVNEHYAEIGTDGKVKKVADKKDGSRFFKLSKDLSRTNGWFFEAIGIAEQSDKYSELCEKNKISTGVKVDAAHTYYPRSDYVAVVHYIQCDEDGNTIEDRYEYHINWQQIGLRFLGIFAFADTDFDAAAQTSHSGEPATISWDHTIGAGDNTMIICAVSGLSAPNAPTWDGNAMTEIDIVSPAKAYYFLSPAEGTAACAANGGNIKVGGSVSFTNVNQSDPFGARASQSGGDNDAMSLTTESDGSMRVDLMGANRDDTVTPTVSLDTGTERTNDVVSQNQFRIGLFIYTDPKPTAGTVVHTWTEDAFTELYMAFEVKAAEEATAVSGPNNDDFILITE